MVSGPEMARVIEEDRKSDYQHHKLTNSIQVTFFNQVKTLSKVIEEMGNSFTDTSNDLLVLDTRILADPSVVSRLRCGDGDPTRREKREEKEKEH